MEETYYNKVAKIAQVKYEIEKEVLDTLIYEIDQCYKNGFTPRRTVEVLAEHLFG